MAHKKGRENIFASFFTYITPFIEHKAPITTTVDEKMLENKLYELQASLSDGYGETTFEIVENELVVKTGHSGRAIDVLKIKEKIIKLLEHHEDVNIEAVISDREFEAPNVDEIYEKVHTEPMDAFFDRENNKITAHVDGYDFDKNTAVNILSAAKPDSEYKIPITVIEAN